MKSFATLVVTLAAATSPIAVANSVPDRCAGGDIVNMAPAELLDLEDRFRAGLPPVERARLDAALPRTGTSRIAQCASRDGAACDANAYLHGFRQTGLMPRFLGSICPRPKPAAL